MGKLWDEKQRAASDAAGQALFEACARMVDTAPHLGAPRGEVRDLQIGRLMAMCAGNVFMNRPDLEGPVKGAIIAAAFGRYIGGMLAQLPEEERGHFAYYFQRRIDDGFEEYFEALTPQGRV